MPTNIPKPDSTVKFLVRPRPLPGESLSSWRYRSALANGISRYPHHRNDRPHSDPDRIVSEHDGKWLSDLFALPVDDLKELTLDSGLAKILDKTPRKKRLRWVLPHRPIETAAGSSRPMFCPLCLHEDETPYFRLTWRFAYMTHCKFHGIQLLDECPVCLTSPWPSSAHRSPICPGQSLRFCQKCGADLGSVDSLSSPDRIPHRLREWVQNSTPLPRTEASDSEYLDLWYVCQLLIRKSSAQMMKLALERHGIYVSHNDLSADTFEALRVSDRSWLITAARWLMDRWPHNFLSVSRAAKLSRANMSGTLHLASEEFRSLVSAHLTIRDHTRGTRDRVTGALRSLQEQGVHPSKSDVRRYLGVSESTALNKVMSQRRLATVPEFIRLWNALSKELGQATEKRAKRFAATRDQLILLIFAVSDMCIDAVCELSLEEIRMRLQLANGNCAAGLGHYLAQAEPLIVAFQAYAERFDRSHQRCFFISRSGLPVGPHGLRARVSRAMVNGFDPLLWRSVDVFRAVLVGSTH